MELWFLLVASLCLFSFLCALLNLFKTSKNLPPGPSTIPIIGNFLWLLKSSKNFGNVQLVLRQLRDDYGPIVTLQLGSIPSVFITTHEAAHRALVQGGSAFAGRPLAFLATQVLFNNHRTVATIPYCNQWRLLRQNLMSMIHPSRLIFYSHCREWAADVLMKRLLVESKTLVPLRVVDHFQHAMYCLLVYMCFGEKLEDKVIDQILVTTRATLANFTKFNVLNFMPRIGKFVFKKLWKELLQRQHDQSEILLPFIRTRREKKKNKDELMKEQFVCYLDTLLDLKLRDAEREISEDELVSLCFEFLSVGTDTSITTLQWLMAYLVNHQDIQEKLHSDITRVVKKGEVIKEEHLKQMPYLKAVVLETLRRRPPGNFLVPRAAVEDTKLDGYDIPKNAIVNFTIGDMALDPNVWEDPMVFKPERFLDGNGNLKVFDIKGVKEIKMMPFGAGRRVCPAISLAILHQEHFVANLIRDFKWTADGGNDVDMSERQDFSIVMKNPLMAIVSPRIT